MNLGMRVGLGAGLAGGLLIAAVVATSIAAVTDNYEARRVDAVSISCPDTGNQCLVEVRAVRPLKAAVAIEAEDAGFEAVPLPEKVLRRRVGRGVLTTFLQDNTSAIP